MEQPTLEQATTAYLQWAESNCTEAFRRRRERIFRQVQPIIGKLPLLQVNCRLFDLAQGLPDSKEKRRLLVVINSANVVIDWALPRLEHRPLRITLDSMQRTLKDFLYSQKLRPQMQQLRDRNPPVASTADRAQKRSA